MPNHQNIQDGELKILGLPISDAKTHVDLYGPRFGDKKSITFQHYADSEIEAALLTALYSLHSCNKGPITTRHGRSMVETPGIVPFLNGMITEMRDLARVEVVVNATKMNEYERSLGANISFFEVKRTMDITTYLAESKIDNGSWAVAIYTDENGNLDLLSQKSRYSSDSIEQEAARLLIAGLLDQAFTDVDKSDD